MQSSKPNQTSYYVAYTVCLYIVAVVALMCVAAHQMLLVMVQEEEPSAVMTALFRFLQSIELIIFLSALAVAILRSKG